MVNGRGIKIVYSCVGYGIMSFWIAFVVASAATFKKKAFWLIFGLLFIWLLNITRMSLLLVATNKGWKMPLGLDHHTWFNIFAYLFIFIFIYLFSRQQDDRIAKDISINKP
jgi:exosortase/archaeosortase family protein